MQAQQLQEYKKNKQGQQSQSEAQSSTINISSEMNYKQQAQQERRRCIKNVAIAAILIGLSFVLVAYDMGWPQIGEQSVVPSVNQPLLTDEQKPQSQSSSFNKNPKSSSTPTTYHPLQNDQGPVDIPIAQRGFHELDPIHRHEGLTFPYPTVGIPEVGKTYNNTKVALEDLARFDDQLNQLFKPYDDTNCQFERIASDQTGGVVICKNFLSQIQGIIGIGIGKTDDFGCQISTRLRIPNNQYECRAIYDTPCSTNKNNTHFNNVCLGAVTEMGSSTFYTLEDILKLTGLTKKHLFFRMDCEGCEYAGLKYFPVEGLENIDQILMEVHFGKTFPEEWGMLDIYRTLMTYFVPVNLHMNNHGCIRSIWRHLKSWAVQLTLVNKKLITLNSNSRSYKLNPLNRPNKLDEDCQMS